MNISCKHLAGSAMHFAVLAIVMLAHTAAAQAQTLSWIWDTQSPALEKPWALGVKPQSGWRLEVVKPEGLPVVKAVINRSWPATVHLARPKVPLITGALTPVSYTPYGAPETTGIASFYWQEQMTSSGERFDKTAMTAAHKTLPMHTRVRVTRLDTGRSVIVRINDRGPFKPGRIVDLSDAAAEALGMRMMGLAQVKIDVVR
jgi:rare lipoprotein A (peptidoglycan hydrolase)